MEMLQGLPQIAWEAIVLVWGLLLGSFGAACVYRIPREIPLFAKGHHRSRCPECGKNLLWYDNIPLLSFIFLKGRCRFCQKKISKVYPIIEFSMALGFWLTFKVYTQTSVLEGWVWWAELVKVLYFTFSFVVVIFIDIEFRIIPDRFNFGGFFIALGAAIAWGEPSWGQSLAGAALGFGMFFSLAWFYEKYKGIEGLGFGDVKMMAWLGAWLGAVRVPEVILFASLAGVFAGLFMMFKSKQGFQTALPFGPFLAVAAYAVWILTRLVPDFSLFSIV
jgi:leader peptidase (prepilin peptidase)/N-methyltransferase